jgi:uncharacterized membrane protein YccC
VTTKRHAKPTAEQLAERAYRKAIKMDDTLQSIAPQIDASHALAERTYRKVLKFHSTLLNQMAHIRLDIATARREDREHMKTLVDHCARLLKEKETLQRQLYAVKEMKENPLQWLDVVPPQTTIHSHEPGKQCTEYCRTIPARPKV